MSATIGWALRRARDQTLRLAAEIPDNGDSAPAGQDPRWLLGHLVLADTYLLHLLDGSALPDRFPRLLATYGPERFRDPAARLGAIAELLADLTETGHRRDTLIAAMTGPDFDRAMPDPVLAGSQPTIGHHLQALVCHEGYHAGQLSSWRRRLELAPVRWTFAPPA